eukprot:772327-Pelagomonas_calceolata.AAC.5
MDLVQWNWYMGMGLVHGSGNQWTWYNLPVGQRLMASIRPLNRGHRSIWTGTHDRLGRLQEH